MPLKPNLPMILLSQVESYFSNNKAQVHLKNNFHLNFIWCGITGLVWAAALWMETAWGSVFSRWSLNNKTKCLSSKIRNKALKHSKINFAQVQGNRQSQSLLLDSFRQYESRTLWLKNKILHVDYSITKRLENNVQYIQLTHAGNSKIKCRDGIRKVWKQAKWYCQKGIFST